MDDLLTTTELSALIGTVFEPSTEERRLAVIIDLPDGRLPDKPDWRRRREIAAGWVRDLVTAPHLEASLFAYRNVRTNNADLPGEVWPVGPDDLPADADRAGGRPAMAIRDLLASHPLVMAPTELSATAPLKMLARELGFRAATMPGFSPAMVPALRLDWAEVNRRVTALKELLDAAISADIAFRVDDREDHHLRLDLRHRTAHASGGLLRTPGTAGNLPSGEAYIVPYEGEVVGDPTASSGVMPVQHGDEVVVYRIESNLAVEVITSGRAASAEAERLRREPAYGNLAELGLGVLGDMGIKPIGEVLLDEKLGLHVAFGRSEHFGGQVGPEDFSSPEAVVHQDHVYLRAIQPRISVVDASLALNDGTTVRLVAADEWVLRL